MSFWNASRGLRIEETDFTYLTEGFYGVVFINKLAGRVRKVFTLQEGPENAFFSKSFVPREMMSEPIL
jgi:hypothetical protein